MRARRNWAALKTVAVAVLVAAWSAPAGATPVASNEAERAQLGRTFPEPLNSTDFIQFGPVNAAEEHKNGWSLNEKLFPGYVDFTTVAAEMGDPYAFSPGPDGLPPWDPKDAHDGLPLYVVKVTDESVPDRDKQYVVFFNAHAAEPCGREGTPRFLEDLLIWRTTDPGHVLDDGTGIAGGTHKITVADLLKKVKLFWVIPEADGWAQGDGDGSSTNVNYAGSNSNRQAYQDGWVFPANNAFAGRGYSVLQQPEGAAMTSYLKHVRDTEISGRPFAVSNDQHGPLPVGAILLHDQGNSAAKVDRTEDYAARTASKMDQVFARYATQTGLTATQLAASQAGSVRDELFRRYTQLTGSPVNEKAAFLTLEWAEYATVWESLDYTVSGTWGGWAGSDAGLGADAISFEVDCDGLTGQWIAPLWQLFVDNVRAIDETAAVHAAAKVDDVKPVRTYDFKGPVGFIETGKRVTDSDGNPSPPPLNYPNNPIVSQIQQTHYDVANTDYFRDLRPLTPDPVVEVPAQSPKRLGESVASMVVPDTADTDAKELRAFAEAGGNLVLTDSALRLLPDLTGLPKTAISEGFAYVGYSDLDRSHPWTAGLHKRARQMFDPVGIGFPLMMARDQYWPCSDAGACDPSPTKNSAPIWSVERASWEAKGGTTIATADPPADRTFGGEGGGTTKTTIGTLPVGKGRVVVFGGLLPQPTEQYEHWFGLNGYTISTSGQQLLMRALAWKRDGLKPLPASAKCYSGKTLTIRLARSLRSATVTVKGKRQKVIRGKRLRARIDLRKLRAGRHTVKIVGRTKHGRKLRSTRHFRKCAERR